MATPAPPQGAAVSHKKREIVPPSSNSLPSVTAPSAAPPPSSRRCFSVLYIFAGEQRQSDVGDCLKTLCKGQNYVVKCDNIDLLRDASHDVLAPELQDDLRNRLKSKVYDVLVITPPCNTHSRARSANSNGPPPVRSKAWPLGFPWLRGKHLASVKLANALMEFTWELCLLAHSVHVPWLSEHPEDLEVTPSGDNPASFWATAQTLELAHACSAETAAFFQCPWGAATSKPTRVLGTLRLRSPTPPAMLFRGWPKFSKDGRYLGPLPRRGCGHRHKRRLLGHTKAGKFMTSAAAAYPPLMCMWIARLILEFCLQKPDGGGASASKGSLIFLLSPWTCGGLIFLLNPRPL